MLLEYRCTVGLAFGPTIGSLMYTMLRYVMNWTCPHKTSVWNTHRSEPSLYYACMSRQMDRGSRAITFVPEIASMADNGCTFIQSCWGRCKNMTYSLWLPSIFASILWPMFTAADSPWENSSGLCFSFHILVTICKTCLDEDALFRAHNVFHIPSIPKLYYLYSRQVKRSMVYRSHLAVLDYPVVTHWYSRLEGYLIFKC